MKKVESREDVAGGRKSPATGGGMGGLLGGEVDKLLTLRSQIAADSSDDDSDDDDSDWDD